MAANVTDSEDQREEQLANVARLYLQGQTQAAIGKQLGVSQRQISYDLAIVRERWLESSIRNFDEAKAQELAKIDRVELEFWRGWERSLLDKEISNTKRRQGKDESLEASMRKEGQAGDPRFMDGVLKCITKRCEIFGFDSAKKVSLVTDGTSYGPFLTDDERRSRLLALISGQDEESETRSPTIQ